MRKPEEEFFPSLDECNDFIEWLAENNHIDLNQVRFRIRELGDGSANYIITVEWRKRTKDNPPRADELISQPDWVIEKWYWDGNVWTAGFWRE